MIYFIRAVGLDRIKIGFTDKSPEVRLGRLQIGSPVRLERLALMEGDRKTEEALHYEFRHLRSHGEWFAAGPELLARIAKDATPWLAPAARACEDIVTPAPVEAARVAPRAKPKAGWRWIVDPNPIPDPSLPSALLRVKRIWVGDPALQPAD